MEPGPTTLQPRPVRAVRLVRVAVEAGPDLGARTGDDGAARVVTVGTSADCGLVLTDPTVSRYHLEVRHAPDGLALIDLGSRNGSFVGTTRIERAVVPPGARVRIGATTLVVDDAGARGAPAADDPLPGVIAVSPAMREVVATARRLARVGTSVLIEGETGVGKEVVAQAIHEAGPRRDGPFVVVDCGSLPPTLIASQLFGHEKGSFTGADARRAGAFERAHGGTLFLDEIGELPLELQPALLGVLERHRFTRVGGAEPVDVDVRVIAATHRDLRGEVNAGSFRADLYFRLAVARLLVPPLRDRPEDLEPLIVALAEKLTGVPGDNPLAGAMDTLRRQRWAGNVRELRNVVEAAIVLGQLPGDGDPTAAPPAPGELRTYREAKAAALAGFERDYLTRLLAAAGGNVSEASRRARMDRPYLIQLLRRHDLK